MVVLLCPILGTKDTSYLRLLVLLSKTGFLRVRITTCNTDNARLRSCQQFSQGIEEAFSGGGRGKSHKGHWQAHLTDDVKSSCRMSLSADTPGDDAKQGGVWKQRPWPHRIALRPIADAHLCIQCRIGGIQPLV